MSSQWQQTLKVTAKPKKKKIKNENINSKNIKKKEKIKQASK